MRDPERIPKILEQFGTEWKKVPDWRLSQFFINFLRWLNSDPFYVEDDTFIKLIQKFMEETLNENN